MAISGLTIIRNAVRNGYLIAEVIDTLAAIAQEIIVCDGYSDDGTADYLRSRSGIKLYQSHWDSSQYGGTFADITNFGLSHCSGDYIFSLQADELIHESQLPMLKQLIDTGGFSSLVFHFNHIRYGFEYELDGGYKHAIRVVRNGLGIRSSGDAFSFDGAVTPQIHSDIHVYHFGYVFIWNILHKMVNHADFYSAAGEYQHRKAVATEFLHRLRAGEQLDPLEVQKVLEPEYTLQRHDQPIPACVERLRGASRYSLPG